MGWERGSSRPQKKESPAGCMSGFLQLFDLHQRLFRASTAFPAEPGDENSQGVIAPRNSVLGEEEEEDDDDVIPTSISFVLEEKTTKKLQELDLDFKSEEFLMPKKTNNVVARLMGLENTPDQLSKLRMSSSRKLQRESAMTPPPLRPRNSNSMLESGTRSLPDTPRASSARKSADADPRLSLQLSFKENSFFGDDVSLVPSPSPKTSKPRRKLPSNQNDENRSPRQYASDIMKQVKETVTKRMVRPRRRFENPPPPQKRKKKTAVVPPRLPTLKPISTKDLQPERFVEKMKKPPSERTPPQKIIPGEIKAQRNALSFSGPEEYFYIRCVLERTGVRGCTPRSLASVKWYSPSHPLDPLVFHQLERSFQRPSGTLRHRCNRKLLFNLADELLADILWPFLQRKPWEEQWRRTFALLGSESIAQGLWRRIRCSAASPAAELETLMAADLAAGNVRTLLEHPAVSKETESVVSELGSFLLDSLMDEIITSR